MYALLAGVLPRVQNLEPGVTRRQSPCNVPGRGTTGYEPFEKGLVTCCLSLSVAGFPSSASPQPENRDLLNFLLHPEPRGAESGARVHAAREASNGAGLPRDPTCAPRVLYTQLRRLEGI